MSNSKLVVQFLLVDFGEGFRLLGICSMGFWDMFQVAGDMFCCDRGKQSHLLLRPTEVQLGLQVWSGV